MGNRLAIASRHMYRLSRHDIPAASGKNAHSNCSKSAQRLNEWNRIGFRTGYRLLHPNIPQTPKGVSLRCLARDSGLITIAYMYVESADHATRVIF